MRLELIHIPKCAGTTLGKTIYDEYPIARHRTLKTIMHDEDINLSDTLFIAILRNPIDRFLSSYNYHIHKSYNGIYTRKYTNLKSLQPDEYLRVMLNEIALKPQHWFLEFPTSLDINLKLIRFSNLKNDLIAAIESIKDEKCKQKFIPRFSSLKQYNKQSKYSVRQVNVSLKKKLLDVYSYDFFLLNRLNK